MRNRTRVIAAAAVTAALAAASTATAMASTTGTKPNAHATTVSVSVRCAPDSALAGLLGVSPTRLDQALRAVKVSLITRTGNVTEDQFDAALARNLGISQAQVRRAFAAEKSCGSKPAGSKSPRSGTAAQPGDEALAAAVARDLHVSTAAANAALRPLFAAGNADPSSPTFATAAHSLGVSPQQLAAALAYAKQSLAGGN
jgi:2-hydroxychromene-2-carboxylate isomerase